MADSSLRLAQRVTFVSRTFCAGVYFLCFEGRTSRALGVEGLNGVNLFVTRQPSPALANHGLHIVQAVKLRNVQGGNISEMFVNDLIVIGYQSGVLQKAQKTSVSSQDRIPEDPPHARVRRGSIINRICPRHLDEENWGLGRAYKKPII